MAFKILNYNVDKSVGERCANIDTDVLLVRFLLRRVSQAPRFMGPCNSLKMASTFDAELKASILWFQNFVRKAGRKITVDGIVSHAPYGDGDYTINYLYSNYHKYYPQFKGDIMLDPDAPSALKTVQQRSGYGAA